MKQSLKNSKRIVIKIGSSLFYQKDKLDLSYLASVVGQIGQLVKQGNEVIVVSSGAIALGMSVLGLSKRPKELASLQAAAALGQHELMELYRRFLKEKNLSCAQLLLTWEDFNDRARYLNAKSTLLKLLGWGSVPVINENDTISTDEIKFGDNDRLSALVATLVDADLLIILSDVDGLLDAKKQVVRVVPEINAQIKALVCPSDNRTCVGGMITKIEAASITVASGIPCVIANGSQKNIIADVASDAQAMGNWTLFVPKKGFMAARERWIAFGTKPKGKIVVDDGAKAALINKKSLLAVGVVGVIGDFASGSTVSVIDTEKNELARGKVGVSAKELEKVKGRRFDREIIHRDNIVIL